MTSAAALEDHFYSLTAKNKVLVLPCFPGLFPKGEQHGLQGTSCRQDRLVFIPRILSVRSYLVAMHELGHVLGPWQGGRTLIAEAGAWKWAREHAAAWGKAGDQIMHRGLMSHLLVASLTQGGARPTKIPERSHYFWSCLPPLADRRIPWLDEANVIPPWTDIMAEPGRPRCAFCTHWKPPRDVKGGPVRNGLCRLPVIADEAPRGSMPSSGFCEEYRCHGSH